ncbi:MAG: hypothetical protein FWE68_06080, partial [Defluviitaleaceae bacterium]|nr:hypothetical protein [Defluviitaleaceae bacterium]
MTNKSFYIKILQAVCVCLLTVSACILLYSYDNKYTAATPRGAYGTMTLTEQDTERANFLISGWAVYGGVLLTPEDFENYGPIPDEYIFIGQHGQDGIHYQIFDIIFLRRFFLAITAASALRDTAVILIEFRC